MKTLGMYGYVPFKHTPGMWLHTTRPITFTLAVDDVGIKYFNKDDANHVFQHSKTNTPLQFTDLVIHNLA